MNLRAFFDRFARPPVASPRRPDPFAFEADWAALLAELRLPPAALRDVLVADSLHPHFHYKYFTRSKKGGGSRLLASPDAKLKRIQQEIAARHLNRARPHPAAVAYRRGKSTADHAWAHAGADTIVTADVRDFFPSTAEWRVEAWWRRRLDDADHARLLTRLTTDRDGLPQGAPTSPPLSNLVNAELDARIADAAERAGARYTRFCDDLAFSWRGCDAPADFAARVRSELHAASYELHPEKGWRVWTRKDEPVIVGAVLTRDGKVRLPAEVAEAMRALKESREPDDLRRLAGYRGYAAMMTRQRKAAAADRPARTAGSRLPSREDGAIEGQTPF